MHKLLKTAFLIWILIWNSWFLPAFIHWWPLWTVIFSTSHIWPPISSTSGSINFSLVIKITRINKFNLIWVFVNTACLHKHPLFISRVPLIKSNPALTIVIIDIFIKKVTRWIIQALMRYILMNFFPWIILCRQSFSIIQRLTCRLNRLQWLRFTTVHHVSDWSTSSEIF